MQPSSLSVQPPHLLANGHVNDYRRALDSARQVQQGLFPRHLPRVPGWDFAACCRPALQVGGDYYDLFDAGSGRVGVALGDVSGKGLGPALVMAHLHGLVRALLPANSACLGRFAANLNDRLVESLPESWFVTLFVAIVELATGSISYVNAGHPPPLLLHADSTTPSGLNAGGTALGAFPGEVYALGEARLPPGGLLAIFSDGLTEARNAGGAMFRTQQVAAALLGERQRPAEGMLAGLLEAVERFTGAAEPTDDLTVMLLRREPIDTDAPELPLCAPSAKQKQEERET